MGDDLQHRLHDEFAIDGHVSVARGPGGFAVLGIDNQHGSAVVCLHGGHVLSYRPSGQQDVLWVSRHSRYEPGRAIRGGIPICWPWFADHPEDPSKPAHGLVRAVPWEIRDTAVVHGDATRVRLRTTDTEASRAIWPHRFEITVTVTVGSQLQVQLTGLNCGDRPMVCGGALHAYFAVGSAQDIVIRGLGRADLHRQSRPDDSENSDRTDLGHP